MTNEIPERTGGLAHVRRLSGPAAPAILLTMPTMAVCMGMAKFNFAYDLVAKEDYCPFQPETAV